MTRSEVRLTVGVLVVFLAAIVAIWPRGGDPAESGEGGSPWSVADGTMSMSMPADGELTAVRALAGLRPCPAPAMGAPAPAGPLAGITVPCLGGPGRVDLAAALAGRPALLNVWASWCGPCRKEIPVLEQYARRPDAVAVVGIDVRDDAEVALGLLADLGARYPSVVDTSGELWRTLRVPAAIPVSYLLRPDGTVRRVEPLAPFRTPDEVALAVRRHLAEP